MRLLITGGAGFIGSNFIRYMIEKYPHYQIVNLDLLTYAGSREKLKDVESHPHYAFVQGNIGDSRLVDALVSGKSEAYGTTAPAPVDVIVNFAAESHVDRSIADPGVFIRTNLVGTHVLLESARTYKVKKFVQISTDEVYGSLGDTGCFTEESPLSPNNPYSASKAGADLLVRAYHETYGLPVNITRCSNNFGPYQHPEKLIPLMTTNALLGKKLPIYGDGGHVRDWLHVADHCSAVDLVIHSGRPGEIYNIGGNNEHKNSEIVRKILAVLQKPESLIEFVEDRPGHDRRYAINADKIRRELGWRPVYEFATALRETVLWYKNRL